MFPPGRATLVTKPFPTGSLSCAITMGIIVVAALTLRVAVGPPVTMISTLSRTKLGRQRAQFVSPSSRISLLDDDVLAGQIAEIPQPLPERLFPRTGTRALGEVADPRYTLSLLRLHGERRREEGEGASEPRAPVH